MLFLLLKQSYQVNYVNCSMCYCHCSGKFKFDNVKKVIKLTFEGTNFSFGQLGRIKVNFTHVLADHKRKADIVVINQA